MIQLFKFLLFGKICSHKWKHDQAIRPFNNSEKHIYICEKCGEIKVVKLEIKVRKY